MSEADKILRVGIQVDPTDAQSGRDEVVKSFDDIARASLRQSQATTTAWQRAWQIIRTGAIAMGASFGAFQFVSFIRQSVELAARFETLGVVMKSVGAGAGYSAGYLSDLEKNLRKVGISMKESRQTIITMIQAQLDLNNAVELARVAQNAAVTANLNSSETLGRLMIAVQNGNSIIARTIGLQVNWEKAYADMALQLKKNVGELTETQKAQARVNAVIAAGKPIADAYTASMGTAAKQLRSSERYMEDLKTVVGQAFTQTYTAGVFAYAAALQAVAKWVMANGPIVQGIVRTTLVMGALTAGIFAVNAALTASAGGLAAWSLALLSSPLAPFIATAGAIALIMGRNAAKTEEARIAMDQYIEGMRKFDPRQLEKMADVQDRRIAAAKTRLDAMMADANQRPDRFLTMAEVEERGSLQRSIRNWENMAQRYRGVAAELRANSPEAVRAAKAWEQSSQTIQQLLFENTRPTGLDSIREQFRTIREQLNADIVKGYWTQEEGLEKLNELTAKQTQVEDGYRRKIREEFNQQRVMARQEIADQERINALWASGARNVDALTQSLELERQIKEKTRNLDRDLGPGAAERVAGEMRELARRQREGQVLQAFAGARNTLADAQALRNAADSGAEAVDHERRALERRNAVWQQTSLMGPFLATVYGMLVEAQRTLDQQTNNLTAIEALKLRAERLEREAEAMKRGTEALRERRREEDLLEQMRAYKRANPNLTQGELQAYENELRRVSALEEANARYEQQVVDVEQRIREIRSNTLRQLQQTFSDSIANMLSNGTKGWQQFFDNIRQMFLRLVADMLSAAIMKRVVKILFPNDKTLGQQVMGASAVMLQAAQLQVTAANTMAAAAGVQASTPQGGAIGNTGNKIAGSLAVAATSFTVGNMLGGLTKNPVAGGAIGAAGGAAAGAAIGTFLLPGVGTALGAVVGGVAGFIGGLFGARRAAKAAAEELKRFREASASLQATMSILRIRTAGGNASLQEALEQNRRYFEQLDKDITNTYKGKKREDERRRLLAESNRLEQQEAARIRAEFARKQREATEDLQVRALRARGLEREADALALALEQQREYEAAVREGFTAAQLEQLRYVQALEKVKAATQGVSNALLNAPTGFKVALERFVATTAENVGAAMGTIRPGDGTSSASGDTTVILTLDGKAVAKGVVNTLKRQAQTQFGTTLRWSEVQP